MLSLNLLMSFTSFETDDKSNEELAASAREYAEYLLFDHIESLPGRVISPIG